MSNLADVAIVGYGPVGQALAIALAQSGHRVVVLERWSSLYSLPRAVVYDHEVARILQGLGVADDMASSTMTSKYYELRNGEGKTLRLFQGMDEIAISGWPDKVGFYQPALESVQDKRVREFSHLVDIRQGWEVESAEDRGEEVCLSVRKVGSGDSATRETVRARYVVGCDGAGSVVRQAMGSGYEDLGFSADWLVVDYKPLNPADWSPEQLQICDPGRPTTLVAGGPGRRRAEFMLLPGETKEEMDTPEVVWRLLEKHGWHPGNASLERRAVYTFRGCVARKWRVGRMLLAGDAAHLTPPFAGQGLCAGLRDVAALAWRLDHVLTGRAIPALLDSYAQERSDHVRRFVEFAIELGRMICILDPVVAAERDGYMLGPGANEPPRYPDTTLAYSDLVRVGDSHAGQLSLQARVRQEGQVGRFDDVVGRGFILLSMESDVDSQLDDAQHQFLQKVGIRIVEINGADGFLDEDGRYQQWFDSLGCRNVLIRPDFYIYGAGDARTLVNGLRETGLWGSRAYPAHDCSGNVTELVANYFHARQLATMSPVELKRRLDKHDPGFLAVDVRNPLPLVANRIAGAISVPEQQIAHRCKTLPRDKVLVLYCWDAWCGLATSAARTLVDQGFQVKELSGGIRVWESLGFPVETSNREETE